MGKGEETMKGPESNDDIKLSKQDKLDVSKMDKSQ